MIPIHVTKFALGNIPRVFVFAVGNIPALENFECIQGVTTNCTGLLIVSSKNTDW